MLVQYTELKKKKAEPDCCEFEAVYLLGNQSDIQISSNRQSVYTIGNLPRFAKTSGSRHFY